MNQANIDKIVEAVLYEGYNLYPYRPSVKSRCRWTFGGLYPQAYSEAVSGSDASSMQVQCLLHAKIDAALEVQLRFLQLVERTIGALPAPCDELPSGAEPEYQAVDSLLLDGTRHQSWQEAVERRVTIGPLGLDSLLAGAKVVPFSAPSGHTLEPLRRADGQIVAVAVRDQQAVEGSTEISAEIVDDSVFRITLGVFNRTPMENAGRYTRDEASRYSLAAMNAVLIARQANFVSLIDPPDALRTAAAACRNLRVWPVLVGEPGEQDAMLAAPIILYDYPQIAPESPGDLFDGTEIDEILSLRIMTLTDEEKAIAGSIDDRTRRLIERTESLAPGQLAGLHGAIRPLQSIRHTPCAANDFDNSPFAESPKIDCLRLDDVELRPGDRVRLRPGLGGDIFDLALNGKTATIESIEQDFENHFHIAVTVDDDPGQDLGRARQPGHRFFFKPEEVARLDESEAAP